MRLSHQNDGMFVVIELALLALFTYSGITNALAGEYLDAVVSTSALNTLLMVQVQVAVRNMW